jgi:hypothetical protein
MRRQVAEAQTQIPHLREIGYPWPTQKEQDPLVGIMQNLSAQNQAINGAALHQECESGVLNQ